MDWFTWAANAIETHFWGILGVTLMAIAGTTLFMLFMWYILHDDK